MISPVWAREKPSKGRTDGQRHQTPKTGLHSLADQGRVCMCCVSACVSISTSVCIRGQNPEISSRYAGGAHDVGIVHEILSKSIINHRASKFGGKGVCFTE